MPAVFLVFYNIYIPDFIFADILNWTLKIGMGVVVILVIRNATKWSKDYDNRILPMKSEVEQMIKKLG